MIIKHGRHTFGNSRGAQRFVGLSDADWLGRKALNISINKSLNTLNDSIKTTILISTHTHELLLTWDLDRGFLVSKLPMRFVDIADNEEDDGESSTQESDHHQHFEAVNQPLGQERSCVKNSKHIRNIESRTQLVHWCATRHSIGWLTAWSKVQYWSLWSVG